MKEMLESIPRIELALIIIGVFVLILGIILGYAMMTFPDFSRHFFTL